MAFWIGCGRIYFPFSDSAEFSSKLPHIRYFVNKVFYYLNNLEGLLSLRCAISRMKISKDKIAPQMRAKNNENVL